VTTELVVLIYGQCLLWCRILCDF